MKKKIHHTYFKLFLKPVLRNIKPTLLIMLLLSVSFVGYSQYTELNLDLKDVSIKTALSMIENQSDYYFVYSPDLIDVGQKIEITTSNNNVKEVLDVLLGDKDIQYQIKENQILLLHDDVDVKEESLVAGAVQQNRSISGKVLDASGMPLIGVSVTLQGTTVGVLTDLEGNYSLTIPQGATTLLFSFIGMQTETVTIGTQTVINVSMKEAAIGLDEVVVTALGIEREAKTLTYSAQQVSGAEVMKSQDMNFMNALSGRTAGLEIKQTASGAGGSTKTVLRGAKSFTGDSSPLYVIDGVPMVNNIGGQAGMWGGVDEGDGISQLNPDDIESISVLKGANAAILYGSQGANGVVMITTKKGKEGAVDINFSNATTFENITFLPKMQYKYGAEDDGVAKESWSYTPHTNPDGFTESKIRDFFNTGFNMVNNISISGGNSTTTAYFSYGNTKAKGIIPTNEYIKHNVSLRQSTKIFKNKVTLSSNVMFTDEMAYNRTPNGWEQNPITGLYWFPRHRNINDFNETVGDKDYPNYMLWNNDRNLYEMNWFVEDHWQNNPWWLMYMQSREDGGKRVIASANVTWDITSKLNFTVKGNYDYANKKNEYRRPAGGNTVQVARNGTWFLRDYKDRLSYMDAILAYNNDFGDFSLNAIAGLSYHESRYGDGISVNTGNTASTQLVFPNVFTLQNIGKETMVNTTLGSRAIKEGYFSNASVGFKEMVFLDLSGRFDRSSTLALADVGTLYFYPAVGFSAIVSQMVSLPSFVTFGKVRGSYTTVANDLGFDNIYARSTISNNLGITTPTRPDWPEAKPEMITSIELGTDWRFLEGRLGFDLTWYYTTSEDQRITINTLQGTGYATRIINAGEILNKGIELLVDAEPVSVGDFSWRTSVSFAHNKNKIIEVWSDKPTERIHLGSSEGYYSYITAGGSYGDIYTYMFDRDEQGRIKFSVSADGQYTPMKTTETVFAGSVNPDFTIGWNNTFNYKRWSMGFLVNGVFGGKVMSMTEAVNDAWGVSERSADDRDRGHVEVNGVIHNPGGANHGESYTETDPKLWYTVVGDRNGITGNYMYDRTNVRLTQFSLTYDIPVRTLNLPLKSASVGLIGQNLFFLYIKAPYDPERTMSASRNAQGLDNFSTPSTRTYGFNIKINF